MATPINYTENIPQMLESDWKSDDTFTFSILSNVYKVADKNLESIFPYHKDISQCEINDDNLLDPNFCGDNPDVKEIMNDFRGPTVYIGIWLSLAVIFTIVGIIWCICNKCCCCCKAKDENDLDYLVNTDSDEENRNLGLYEVNSKSNTNFLWKVVVGVLMTCWMVGFSFSVFMSYASNEGMRTSIFELYDNLDLALNDAELYINITKRQIDAAFITSYGNLSALIREEIPQVINRIPINSETISSKIQLQCDALILKLEHLTNHNVNDKSKLDELMRSLHELQTTLNQIVNPFLSRLGTIGRDFAGDVEEALRKSKEQLDSDSKTLNDALDKIDINEARSALEDANENWLGVTGSAIYGSFMGFNLILLLILIGIIIGSVVVWFGRGSAKNIGFIFYRCSTVMMFMFGWLIVSVMLNQFVISGFMTRTACQAVRDLENSTDKISTPSQGLILPFHIENMTSFDDTSYIVPSYSYVVTHCKYDDSAYMSFQLEQVYNVSSIWEILNNFLSRISDTKIDGQLFFIKNANAVYSSLYKDLEKLEVFKDVVRETDGTESLYTDIHFLVVSLLQEIEVLKSGEIVQNFSTTQDIISDLVVKYAEFVYAQITQGIGKCHPVYHAINATLHTFCYKVFAPVAVYWWSLQLILFMFVTIIGTALISEHVFK